jgi:hypothetical protein
MGDNLRLLDSLVWFLSAVPVLGVVGEPSEQPDAPAEPHGYIDSQYTRFASGLALRSDDPFSAQGATSQPPVKLDHVVPFPAAAMKPANANLRLGARPYVRLED